MVAAIISAIVGITTAAISAGMRSKRMREAQQESRKLNRTQRLDAGRQRLINRRSFERQRRLDKEQLSFKRQQIEDEQKDMAEKRRSLQKQVVDESRRGAIDRTAGMSDTRVEGMFLDRQRWL